MTGPRPALTYGCTAVVGFSEFEFYRAGMDSQGEESPYTMRSESTHKGV